jgi:hypothetical protein
VSSPPVWHEVPPSPDDRARDLEELARAVVRLVERGDDLVVPPGIFVVRQLWALLEHRTTDEAGAPELALWIAEHPAEWEAVFDEGPLPWPRGGIVPQGGW